MSMPMETSETGPGEPGAGPPGGGGDPVKMLLGLAQQAADAINQLGQMLTQLAGPQGPPPGAGPGGPPGGAKAAAIANMIQRGG